MDIIDIILGAKLGGGGGSGGGSSSFIPSFGTVASVSLGTTWSGNDPYTSTVTVTGYTVTDKTMVSVLPSTAVLAQMLSDGTTNIFITNDNGTLIATAIGAAPTQAMTLSVLCTESDQAAAIENLPAIVGDGVLEVLGATDLTDAVNLLNTDVSDVKNAISQKQDAPSVTGTAGQVLGLDSNLDPVWVDQTGGGGGMNIVNLSGTQITQVGADNTFYVCGELTELTFTAPAVGITMIRFTSGSTPTVCSFPSVTSWMYDFNPYTDIEADKTYDINVLNGIGVAGWA